MENFFTPKRIQTIIFLSLLGVFISSVKTILLSPSELRERTPSSFALQNGFQDIFIPCKSSSEIFIVDKKNVRITKEICDLKTDQIVIRDLQSSQNYDLAIDLTRKRAVSEIFPLTNSVSLFSLDQTSNKKTRSQTLEIKTQL